MYVIILLQCYLQRYKKDFFNFRHRGLSLEIMPDHVRPFSQRYSHGLVLKNSYDEKRMKLSSDEYKESLSHGSLSALPVKF